MTDIEPEEEFKEDIDSVRPLPKVEEGIKKIKYRGIWYRVKEHNIETDEFEVSIHGERTNIKKEWITDYLTTI